MYCNYRLKYIKLLWFSEPITINNFDVILGDNNCVKFVILNSIKLDHCRIIFNRCLLTLKFHLCIFILSIMHSAFNLLVFPNSMFTSLLFFSIFIFLMKGLCALRRNSTYKYPLLLLLLSSFNAVFTRNFLYYEMLHVLLLPSHSVEHMCIFISI